MRVLLISRYNPSHPSVASRRLLSFYEVLEERGHEVTWLTTPGAKSSKRLNFWEIEYPISLPADEKERQAFEESRFFRLLLKFYRTRLNERLPSPLAFWSHRAKRALKQAKKRGEGFDLVIASYGPPAALSIGVFAKRLFACPLVADFRDLWMGNHVYKGLFPFTLLEKVLERRYVAASDLLITVSKGLERALKERYPNKPVKVIYNGYEHIAEKRDRKLGAVYTGTLYDQGNQILSFLKAARGMPVDFFGAASPSTKKMGEQQGARFHPACSREEALKRQAESTYLLLFQFNHPQEGLLGVKIFEYLATDRPILAVGINRKSELGELLREAGGVIFTENDVDSIKRALKKIPEKVERNEAFIRLFSRREQAHRLLNEMESALFFHHTSPVSTESLSK